MQAPKTKAKLSYEAVIKYYNNGTFVDWHPVSLFENPILDVISCPANTRCRKLY